MSIDAEWCRFTAGTTRCVNGSACENPNHREYEDPWMSDDPFDRDRFGRGLPILPGETKPTPMTRATTLAKALDDQYHLGQWKARTALYGLSRRQDLMDWASSIGDPEDRKVWDDILEKALEAGGSSVAATRGNTLHKLTERLDSGHADVVIPDTFRDHITRYQTLISVFAVTWAWIELPLVLPDILVCGTADRVDTEDIVWDLKTGKSLDFAKISIAQQLAIYSRAKYRWDGSACVPAPKMNQQEARVIWLPATGTEAKVYAVDIEQGWDLVTKSVDVRDVRKTRGKSLFTEIEPPVAPLAKPGPEPRPASEEPNPNRLDEVKARVIKIKDAGFEADLAALWASDVPTLKEGGLTAQQLEMVDDWCESVERERSLAF